MPPSKKKMSRRLRRFLFVWLKSEPVIRLGLLVNDPNHYPPTSSWQSNHKDHLVDSATKQRHDHPHHLSWMFCGKFSLEERPSSTSLVELDTPELRIMTYIFLLFRFSSRLSKCTKQQGLMQYVVAAAVDDASATPPSSLPFHVYPQLKYSNMQFKVDWHLVSSSSTFEISRIPCLAPQCPPAFWSN